MGHNPSEQKGDKLPVENFVKIPALKQNALTGMNFKLPNEACTSKIIYWSFALKLPLIQPKTAEDISITPGVILQGVVAMQVVFKLLRSFGFLQIE